MELKRNLKDASWTEMVTSREGVERLDAGVLMHPKVWEASGHVEGFSDPLAECRNCHRSFRADEVLAEEREETAPAAIPSPESLVSDSEVGGRLAETQCPVCGVTGEFTEPREFNLMFEMHMGAVKDEAPVACLRPETAQGIYVNFRNVQEGARQKVPFGIAEVGKAFRNESTPGNFIFRTREFEQMEMQYFVKSETDNSMQPSSNNRRCQ